MEGILERGMHVLGEGVDDWEENRPQLFSNNRVQIGNVGVFGAQELMAHEFNVVIFDQDDTVTKIVEKSLKF